MESSPRPGYYPDPSVPGYIRYWDGSRWVPGTSKPMPEGVGGAASDADTEKGPGSGAGTTRQLSEMSFDDLLPSIEESPGEPEEAPRFPTLVAQEQEREQEQEQRQAPAFPVAPPMSEISFDDPRPAPQAPQSPAPSFPPPPVASASGMGISITGPVGPLPASGPTPAQLAATSQSLRIRLLRPDGKPFDGPEITTGPKEPETAAGPARTGFDAAQRGPKKQPPKVVVKAGPLARLGHALAVLAISALGIVPLGYLMLQSVHDREDKLAARITVPTKMNVLDGTSEACLGGMVAVLLLVTVFYLMRLKRRR
ncbi:MAG: DUF2510 domain-containing protein [Catenulisporales bacterium]|nr:DUF2510 domain-containing protein [Catenulisporales bacterium]